jgi:putative transposase
VPICRALSAHGIKIAPRTYWARAARPPSRRAARDTALTEILARIYEPGKRGRRKPESLYGSLKMWEHLNRQGITVARCTVERLMHAHGFRGVTRERTVRTTTPDAAHTRAPDLVKRNFKAEQPGQLHVADFTYVPMHGGGFGYTALVIDAFAGLIAGWECSLSKETAFVERAIRQAAALRARQGHPISGAAIHHSDAGSQGGFNRSSQHLDHGGGRWDAVGSNCRTRRRVHVGSGRRIGRCGRRCGHRAGLSPRVRCSGSSGG